MWLFGKKAHQKSEWSRRELLLPGALASLIGALLAGCKSKDARSARTSPSSPVSGPGQPDPDDSSEPVDSNPFDSSAEEVVCSNEVDYSLLPDITPNFAPKIKFYGSPDSALVAIDLPIYVHTGILQSVFIVRQSGAAIAQKGISDEADIDARSAARTIIFDNIRLGPERHLVLLFEIDCQSCEGGKALLKYVMPHEIAFENRFRDRPVNALTPSSMPADFYQHQAFADFLPMDDHFTESGNTFHQVSSDDAKYDSAGGLKDFVITDLMGNVLAERGGKTDSTTWSNIMNYPQFICYKLVGEQYYVRTFVRVS